MKINYNSPKIIVLLLLTISAVLNAQQDAQYTQYIYNTVTINPGYAGTRDVINIVGLHRTQWIGIDGAPSTQTLSIHSPIGEGKIGLGGSVINDEIGPVSETYVDANFSYTVPTSENGKISYGLKAGARLFNVDFNKLTRDLTNQAFFNSVENQISPSLGAGAYYHTNKFYIGLSVPNFLETKHLQVDEVEDISTASSVARERLSTFLIAGHTFDLTRNVKFKPAILNKIVAGAPIQVDVSANFLLQEKFTVGVAYRWSAAISAVAAFQVSDSILIGLAYDRETTELAQLNNGSFEIVLRYELLRKYDKLFTPRFF